MSKQVSIALSKRPNILDRNINKTKSNEACFTHYYYYYYYKDSD